SQKQQILAPRINRVLTLFAHTSPILSQRVKVMSEEGKAIEGVDVEISVVLGKAVMPIHQLLKMGRGAVIELDAGADDDAIVLANNKPIAYGGIVIVDDNIGISITDKVKRNLPEF